MLGFLYVFQFISVGTLETLFDGHIDPVGCGDRWKRIVEDRRYRFRVSPTVHGNLIVGPNADHRDKDDTSTKTACLDFVREKAVKSVPSISFRENIRNFTGVRANTEIDDFIIEFADENFLDLAVQM